MMRDFTLDSARGRFAGLRNDNAGAPPLLALHGWLDNAASFIPLMPHLRAFDMVALDLPGHGASAGYSGQGNDGLAGLVSGSPCLAQGL